VRPLFLAVYAEGRTDERFLPVLVQRTAERLLTRRGVEPVDVFEPVIVVDDLGGKLPTREECIVEAAQRAANYHALVVHADADDRARDAAIAERFEPGAARVQEVAKQGVKVCGQLLPVIPVRMVEAWMIADPDALDATIGPGFSTPLRARAEPPRLVEAVSDPKTMLEARLREFRGRRRPLPLGEIYEPLARRVALERLERVPAYQQFVSDLTEVLIALRMAE
jgi:hypothetical protein